MEVEFDDDDLDRLDTDAAFTAGLGEPVVRGFRKALWAIRAATDIRDLYNGGLRCEKLQGDRAGQHSVRLNQQWRLIFEVVSDVTGTRLRILEIVDYHK